MMMKPKAQRGFTVIELMIAVCIIAILATITYPSYREHVNRGNRSEGQALLSDAAAAQERYYAQNFTYITTMADIGKLSTNTRSTTAKYDLRVSSSAGDGGYTLTAEQKFNDEDCGNLTLNALGARGYTGSEKTRDECWR